MAVFLQSVCVLSVIAVISSLSEAIVCLIGQEPDSNVAHRHRWVIPVEDPCKCTDFRPGGMNNRTPGRHFKVIYFDTFLISNSPKEIREWLNCSDAFPGNEVKTTTTLVVNGELMGSVPASQSAVITSYATSKAPVTSDKPVTTFNCPTKGPDNTHYADPNDCTMFYQCQHGEAFHKSCAPGLHFKETDGTNDHCTLEEEASCNF